MHKCTKNCSLKHDGADDDDEDDCRENEFQCADLTCIDSRDRCNSIQDCIDNSDEQNCDECSSDSFQ